jgi:hypothetical protein
MLGTNLSEAESAELRPLHLSHPEPQILIQEPSHAVSYLPQ